MSIEQAIYNRLVASAPILVYVDATEKRVYPIAIPQEANYPCIRFLVTSSDYGETFDGQAITGRLIKVEVQLDCFAETHGDALALAALVRSSLLNLQSAVYGVSIHKTTLVTEYDNYEPALDKFRASQSWAVWHY